MSHVTPFAERVKAGLREALLDAAAALLAAHGYRGLRMVDVAAAVGVSRQTVYNEFGDKEQLTQAVLLRCTAEFLAAVDAPMQSARTAFDALRAGTLAALELGQRQPLVVALVTGGAGGASADLLPFLAGHAQPVLRAAAERVARHLDRLAPGKPHDRAATAVVRLVLSHLLLPTAPAAAAADDVARFAAAALPHPDPHHREE